MSRNAQRDLYPDAIDSPQGPDLRAPGTGGAATLRNIAAERLAAHRSKRAVLEPETPSTQHAVPHISESAKRAREAVVARYRKSPSYRDVLAAETEHAAQAAIAEPMPQAARALVAPVTSKPILAAPSYMTDAVVATDVEEDFAWLDAETSVVASAVMPEAISMPEGALQVRPYEDLPQLTTPPPPLRADQSVRVEEIEGLDEEIAFRLAPEFDDHLIEPLPIQANIIQFPRQLVAARKARPRLAEGPLRTDEAAEYREPAYSEPPPQLETPEFQMRIFEVEPIAMEPAPSDARITAQAAVAEPQAPAAPEWQHMVLDAAEEEDEAPSWVPVPVPEMPPAVAHDPSEPLPIASLELRFMSAAVDAISVGIAFVAFAAVAGWIGGHELRAVPLRTLGVISAGLLALLSVFYQALFFSLSRSTPGMFYSNLVFRTLAGREPSRRMMRRRVGANIIAALPLGLGLLWSIVDKRGLGWNDRISGVFLREF
jgi:hypothetical protein